MTTLVATIQKNIRVISDQIQNAAWSAGRDSGLVKLVVVTKAQPVEVVRAAFEAGALLLGENYPEETQEKIRVLGPLGGMSWHMIGHLQSRKSNLVVEYFDVLHSLDSLRLAERLERQLLEKKKLLPVMIEFNIGGEDTKYGLPAWDEASWGRLIPDIEGILTQDHLQVIGSMAMPPLSVDPEHSRAYFVRLRRLSEYLSHRFGAQYFRELSMGTSLDFVPAVQEGATFVRIGQAILGPRPVKV